MSMRDTSKIPFSGLAAGTVLEPLTLEISAAANDRYWQGAGVDHPLRRAGALYPLIAANVTILAFQQRCPAAMIQTRQLLACHRRADAPATLDAALTVVDRWERRGLPYVAV